MLLDREKTALAVIDIQQVLLPKSEEVTAAYLRAAVRMIRAARVLGLPLLVTEQNPGRLGGTHPEVLPELGDAPRTPRSSSAASPTRTSSPRWRRPAGRSS